MESLVVGLVLWFVGAWAGAVLIYLGGLLIGTMIGTEMSVFWGIFIGWVLSAMWWVFAIVQVVLHIISLLQLLS